jgi:hypothetical protein
MTVATLADLLRAHALPSARDRLPHARLHRGWRGPSPGNLPAVGERGRRKVGRSHLPNATRCDRRHWTGAQVSSADSSTDGRALRLDPCLTRPREADERLAARAATMTGTRTGKLLDPAQRRSLGNRAGQAPSPLVQRAPPRGAATNAPTASSHEGATRERREMAESNCGFRKAGSSTGTSAPSGSTRFADAAICRSTAEAAMTFLAGTGAAITPSGGMEAARPT